MANKDRQARYREKIKELGLQTLRVNILPEAKALIDNECNRTGETQAQVVERCAAQLGEINKVTLELLMKIAQEKDLLKSKPIFLNLIEKAAKFYMKYKSVIE